MICYHATDRESAASILREGFRPGTYFAFRLADAVPHGKGSDPGGQV